MPAGVSKSADAEKTRIMLGLLESVERGFARIALLGVSDLAEIAAICALDSGITIAAIVDPRSDLPRFAGAPVVKTLDEVPAPFDAVLVTDIQDARATIAPAVSRLGADRVLAPELFGARTG